MPPGSRVDGAIVFVVDGVNSRIFNEMLDAGELENFKHYFTDRGIYAPRAVANVPSVTLANLTSLATGEFCGDHGIVGINWFDRNRLIWRNYETIAQKNTLDDDHQAKTIYEYFPQRTTVSLFFQPHRNSTKFIENWTSAGPIYFFGWYKWVDRLTLYRLNIVADIAREQKSWPAITYCYLLAPDFYAYTRGVDTEDYKSAIIHSDQHVGRVLKALERDGILDKLVIALVSDHGHTPVKTHFSVEKVLADELSLKVASKNLYENTKFETRLGYYSKYNTVTYGSGDRYMAICLRKPLPGGQYAPWAVRPDLTDIQNYNGVDIVKTLIVEPAIDCIAARAGENSVRVFTKHGAADFTRLADGQIKYTLIAGSDPLGWAQKGVDGNLLAGRPADGRVWLEATFDTGYPDLPAQILAYFNSRYSGDVAVFAAEGYDFNNNHKSGHGGLSPEDMFTVLSIAGPGIPRKKIPTARTIDLIPTLLEYFQQESNLKNAKSLK